ncbi:glutamate-1-semialdehyde 2,1-aminomutase [Candidatus Poribacteria bacterium]|jgi:glutamate-1-semialdehyde 2,1-aminomutase|nr:glutamate-1-semialdehyde 2,1-aminomutase [Candidatus Poribacteria bacterium]MBT5537140.1 glutamate-1-semialdehyde 2,1-aminomutase [Candidatus Poribacteria bacterium]MBT5713845.1 glutamate-1-semialdehyde 2,1-aminomutase [Candidatus Poribacteria bacterium]MBT7100281.1 glutamate-1-semialdehyde 2,1-aminomutase [Candidatus Poribacteria bacterium]MBT7806590.1 glutamate-1-semialdehyde 2,1-aminomutase [Candidatus Poribacteria bacterium]
MSSRRTDASASLWGEAREVIPGGVNSPVRAFGAVGGTPVFFDRGEGSKLYDVDGNAYIDFVGSWGPLVLGHCARPVTDAVTAALAKGTSFGASTAAEVRLARLIVDAVPSIERVRLVNSGTEATMSAIRVARGFTGRSKIIKVTGCYHGHADHLLVEAGSGATTFGVPTSSGVPADFAGQTLLVPFNDTAAVADVLARHGDDVACMILEPIAGNMGLVPPNPGYLSELRALTEKHGALLVFDEVMTGFRVSYGGAQELYGVTPDMTCLGKIVGGGLPVGAYGGRKDIMACVAPEGPVYQAGTLSGNPLATAAGIAMLEEMAKDGVYERLEQTAASIADGLSQATEAAGESVHIARVGSMVCMFFAAGPVSNYADATKSDTARYGRYFHALLDRGVYMPPSQYEVFFISLAHGPSDVAEAIQAMGEALAASGT